MPPERSVPDPPVATPSVVMASIPRADCRLSQISGVRPSPGTSGCFVAFPLVPPSSRSFVTLPFSRTYKSVFSGGVVVRAILLVVCLGGLWSCSRPAKTVVQADSDLPSVGVAASTARTCNVTWCYLLNFDLMKKWTFTRRWPAS